MLKLNAKFDSPIDYKRGCKAPFLVCWKSNSYVCNALKNNKIREYKLSKSLLHGGAKRHKVADVMIPEMIPLL